MRPLGRRRGPPRRRGLGGHRAPERGPSGAASSLPASPSARPALPRTRGGRPRAGPGRKTPGAARPPLGRDKRTSTTKESPEPVRTPGRTATRPQPPPPAPALGPVGGAVGVGRLRGRLVGPVGALGGVSPEGLHTPTRPRGPAPPALPGLPGRPFHPWGPREGRARREGPVGVLTWSPQGRDAVPTKGRTGRFGTGTLFGPRGPPLTHPA